MSKMMSGTSVLSNNRNVPGLGVHKEVMAVYPKIEQACRDFGLDFFPVVVEMMPYDEISELASYGGFPVRYPHWKFGMEYEELSRGYEFGMHRISEMVINNDPCYIYCLDSNQLVDNVDVIAHAIGHNDFFKNNVFFSATNRKMMDKLANHGTRIRKYMTRWGKEEVTRFIDSVLRIDTLINPSNAWKEKKIKDSVVRDSREYHEVKRLHTTHGYMDGWINTPEFRQSQKDKIRKKEAAEFLDVFKGPEKDIMGWLKNNAPLKPWQQDIISMLYEEAMYFAPQRCTKMMNEGWASFVDYQIMCNMGLAALGQDHVSCGAWEYSRHKMLVLGGKYSQNPYKIGFELFMDIEDRWNKGRFGREYEECTDIKAREDWDKQVGKGREKVFEVRKYCNDYTAIMEYFTEDFCNKNEFFEYKKNPNGEWKIVNRDFKQIKKKMLQRFMNGGLPDIRLMDPNHLGKGWFFMQHMWDGRPLYDSYARETLVSLKALWGDVCVLGTFDRDGEQEYVYICDGPNPRENVKIMTREDYEEEFVI